MSTRSLSLSDMKQQADRDGSLLTETSFGVEQMHSDG